MQADEASVLRNGRLVSLPAAQLVPGDIVEVAGESARKVIGFCQGLNDRVCPGLQKQPSFAVVFVPLLLHLKGCQCLQARGMYSRLPDFGFEVLYIGAQL